MSVGSPLYPSRLAQFLTPRQALVLFELRGTPVRLVSISLQQREPSKFDGERVVSSIVLGKLGPVVYHT